MRGSRWHTCSGRPAFDPYADILLTQLQASQTVVGGGFTSICDGSVKSRHIGQYRIGANNQHHWTTDLNEYNVLGTRGWSKEGVDGYILPTAVSGSVPLYRLYLNAFGGLHLWTTDANEKNVLSTSNGWVDEGVAGFVIPLP